ncbi:N-acetyl-gamma-glutamyl-phosphate reductase [Bacillus thermophilus]|uniref:N-acetyl-gamma-glutamyl-phosphate reductase n=1 Tax=Siminovitchia thermophila TaxID=1245522 RepID=A0ABS2RCC3_9BACI|nr:N-acetyl-gamma-glutamyl-phosphate reductase [Siminovitchia thermophila]MBM7717302.1 N-acetyl-gamma-glutamyl-phosphate reductase [Siminovitchia thermophila]ONK22031.1 N-acetyl-gamma-glutamyl-phosphate reductase [Bacillus sp. VT-16-64]
MKVGIIGATGYGGAELLRILQSHPAFTIAAIYSSSQQGKDITAHYPHLSHLSMTLDEIHPEAIAKQTDIVFLGVPSGISAEIAPSLLKAGCTVIDLSGDFRLKNIEQYEKWYNKKPAPKEWVDQAVYAMPEINRSAIKQDTKFISNPGCYPTATLLGLAPVVQNKLAKEGSIIIDAKSGVSGAGQTASFGTIYSELNENFKIYKVNQHQHIPEMEQMLSTWGYEAPITFSTHLVPMTRGIMSTIYVSLASSVDQAKIEQLYMEFYKDEPFIRIRNNNQFPATKEVFGSNYCDIGFLLDERTGRLTIVSVIDNLMKGAAGQAVQNANILCGLDETAGLQLSPVYP